MNNHCKKADDCLKPVGIARHFSTSCPLLVILAILVYTGPSAAADPAPERPTLGGNKDFSATDIQRTIPHEAWQALKDREYSAYVVLQGALDRKGNVKIRKLLRSHPDKSWMPHAVKTLKQVNIPSMSVFSSLRPNVKAHVIFYKSSAGFIALVYVRNTTVSQRLSDTAHFARIVTIDAAELPKESK